MVTWPLFFGLQFYLSFNKLKRHWTLEQRGRTSIKAKLQRYRRYGGRDQKRNNCPQGDVDRNGRVRRPTESALTLVLMRLLRWTRCNSLTIPVDTKRRVTMSTPRWRNNSQQCNMSTDAWQPSVHSWSNSQLIRSTWRTGFRC